VEVKRLIISKKSIVVIIGLLVATLLAVGVNASNPYGNWTTEEAGAFMGMALMTCAIVAVVWLVIWILVGVWVYKDAEKRGKSGVLWLILVIILGIIGIIIWLVIRPPIGGEKAARMCPNCGRGIPEDARVCPYCNKKFDQ
jgi:hypothetical protein